MDFEFFGNNLTPEQYELLALQIEPSARQCESDLYRSRWFDYAEMHPAKATYLFAHYYQLQVNKFIATCIDARTALERSTSAPKDVFTSKHLISFWNARRVCDSIGCPYDFALEFAQHRALDRMMRVFPQPNQLCGEDFEIDLKDLWTSTTGRSLRYSKGSKFQMKYFAGTWTQKRHIQSLLSQIKTRPAESHPGLLGRLISEGTLDESVLEGEFPHFIIAEAKNNAELLSQ